MARNKLINQTGGERKKRGEKKEKFFIFQLFSLARSVSI